MMGMDAAATYDRTDGDRWQRCQSSLRAWRDPSESLA
jgi:hypothetical protein